MLRVRGRRVLVMKSIKTHHASFIGLFIFFSAILLLSIGVIPTQDAEATKFQGQKKPTTNSNEVCGDELCDGSPKSIEEKINDYLSSLFQKDPSVVQERRFEMGGILPGLFQQDVGVSLGTLSPPVGEPKIPIPELPEEITEEDKLSDPCYVADTFDADDPRCSPIPELDWADTTSQSMVVRLFFNNRTDMK